MKLYQNMIQIETINRWNNQKTKWANKLIGVNISDVGSATLVEPVYMPLISIYVEEDILALSFSNWSRYLFSVYVMNWPPFVHVEIHGGDDELV